MRLISLFSILLLTFACGSQPANNLKSNNTVQAQIIIAFVKTADPENLSLIKNMSAQIDADLEFVRRISGNAGVYKVSSSQTRQQLSKKLQQLAQRNDIKYAEFDQRQTIQNSGKK